MLQTNAPVPYHLLPREDSLDVVYRNAFSIVVRVPDFGTARALGDGSRWSVLSDRKAFHDIRRRGPLFLVFDRTTGERHWLCFEACLFFDDEGTMASPGTLCRLFPVARLFASTVGWQWLVYVWWYFRARLHPSLVLGVAAAPRTPGGRHLLADLSSYGDHDMFREFATFLSDTTFPEELFAADSSTEAICFASRVAVFMPPHRAVPVLGATADALTRVDYRKVKDMNEIAEATFAVVLLCNHVREHVAEELLRRTFRSLCRAPLGPLAVLGSLAFLDPLPETLARAALSIDTVRAELDRMARNPRSLAEHYGSLVPFVEQQPQ